MVEELLNILRLLDRFVGHYPLFLYLIDPQHTLIWYNQYMAQRLPQFRIGQPLNCPRGLWPCDAICPECQETSYDPRRVHKHLLKRSLDSEAREVYIEFLSLPVMDTHQNLQGILRLGVDVTESEKLQEKLREKEKLFKAIINSSSDGIIFLDRANRIVSWNRGAEEIFGYTREEILGQSIERLIPPELIEIGELDYLHKELRAKGEIKKYETQRRHKNGRPIYVDIASTCIYDEQGNFLGISQIIKDITSRKELEFELLRTILELSKINELNEILHSTYEEREILRIILIAITAGEGLRFNRAFLLLVDKEKKVLRGELAIGPSDEQEANRIWSELNKDYHYLKDIVRIYQIDLEGTDKTVNEIVSRMEVPLEAENHLFIQALNKKRVIQVTHGQLPGPGLYSLDIGDSDVFQLLNNDSFVIAPLYSRQEPLGIIIADNCINKREITTEDVEGLKLFASQASLAIENARLYQTLEQRYEDLQKAYRELEENQKKLLQLERLAAIGEMSARVAHEIRNPLVSIGGFARLIERKLSDNPTLRQYAGIISEQVTHLEYILNNMLNMANPPKPEQHLVDIRQVIERALQVLNKTFEQHRIQVTSHFQDGCGPIIGDEMLLQQAFLNLLKNAVEALESREGNREIHIEIGAQDRHLEVRVSDNGPGMEESVLSKIFESFFTTKSRGTGLGLPIVHQVVQSHNGEIQVESAPGKGTRFYLRFPLAPEQEPLEARSTDGN
ncbi:MAG: PAS domain S-box protein [Calditrichaeota bacterium]|nr:MAG: PAS domain S-box protein [Calditrichota bacterium]